VVAVVDLDPVVQVAPAAVERVVLEIAQELREP
jgi:hypothetical protein